MKQTLDHESDLATRKKLYGLPDIDERFHSDLADQLNGGATWREKLSLAINGPGKLSKEEFFYYQLYVPEISSREVTAYLGKERQIEFHGICNSPYWIAVSQDKALLELVLNGAGLPVATSIAVFSDGPRFGSWERVKSKKQLLQFLAHTQFPVFAKPIDGIFGIGAFKIVRKEGRKVVLNNDVEIEFDEFFEYMQNITAAGYLFQNCIEQSDYVTKHLGTPICTTRFLVFNSRTPKIESAVIKIGASSSVADNFWQVGNMVAAIDLETGKITRAVQNMGDCFEPATNNPNTGFAFAELTLEHWHETVQFVLDAASLFPGVGTQSWDIAMTPTGPMVVEFNWGGDLNLHQLAHRRGAMTQSFYEHIQACKR